MDRQPHADEDQLPQSDPMISTGGVPLSEERRRLVLPQWENSHQTIRRMDDLELGDTEPATIFVWEEQS